MFLRDVTRWAFHFTRLHDIMYTVLTGFSFSFKVDSYDGKGGGLQSSTESNFRLSLPHFTFFLQK